MQIEWTENGYEKIEAQIQAIEDLAYEGIFSHPEKEAPKKCQRITMELKKLRQIVLEAMIHVPDAVNKAQQAEQAQELQPQIV